MLQTLLYGPAALWARYALVAAAGWMAERGLAIYDASSGTVTLNVDQVSAFVVSGGLAAVALVWRKVAKAKGGTL